jgi:probable phosphoglycerate mutase
VQIDFQRPFAAPPGATELLLVRHGAVDAPGPGGLVGGRSDPPLNAHGRAQAAALARRLDAVDVGVLAITPLHRTRQTAEPLARARGLEPVVIGDLGEVFLGTWEGHGIHDRGRRGDAQFLRVMREERWDLIPGAEPRAAFATRVRAGLERVADAAPAGSVAVAVTHSAVIAEALAQITGSRPFAFLRCENGSLTRVVRMPDGAWSLLTFNATDHLGGESDPPPGARLPPPAAAAVVPPTRGRAGAGRPAAAGADSPP